MHLLARQILLTVSYTAQFSYPLQTDEIWLRLFQPTTAVSYSKADLSTELGWLVTAGFLETTDDFYFLPGKSATIAQRKATALSTEKKVIEFKPVVVFSRWLPWVVGVAITGSAAVKNARPQDDTDVLLVIEQNRLWLVRPLFILFAFVYGKRRSWQKEEENSWCFNLWLEPTALAQPVQSHSIYTAYEVCQAEWVVSKDGCKEIFFKKNEWAREYLPHFFEYAQKKKASRQSYQYIGNLPVISQFFDILNLLSYKMQLLYMHSHMTRERVSKNAAFFHPRDTRKLISQEQKKLLTQL